MESKTPSVVDVERAWKDQEYRSSLTPAQLEQLPLNPAGEIELNDAELKDIAGGLGGSGISSEGGGIMKRPI